jgi:hypothetical protein
MSRGGGGLKEVEQSLSQALQQAAAEQQRADESCCRAQQLQDTLQIKDACLKDATAALNESKLENRRTAALLQVSQQISAPEHGSRITPLFRSARSGGGRTMSTRTGSWVKRRRRPRD